ncbi:MAG: binding-protein-dependent transport system inner rane component [Thermomicrobiales bacterium]|nr:binding-protein-dependent transport system inner rane component [Thermomicrobiales bacterium]MDF3017934.1 binding-protein-dependent transport system inner rane component [Thermomicrobiales bacterium]
MGTYLIRRLLGLIPVLLVISVVTFLTIALVPGDAASVILGPTATPERAAQVRKRFGLDQPLPVRYAKWMGEVLRGDLGNSILNRQSVTSLLGPALRVTLEQIVLAMLLASTIALVVGVAAAALRGTWIDSALMGFALIGTSVPTFWLGLVLIYVFSVRWKLLPPSGFVPFSEDPVANLRSMVLPSLALAVWLAGPLARFVRSSLIEVLSTQFVTTARAKGLSERGVMRGHALKNALIPTVTFAGLQIGGLLGGAIVTEVVFSLPGIGSLALSGIQNRDFPVVQGVVLVVACGYVLINIAVDIGYVLLDPRIRFGTPT